MKRSPSPRPSPSGRGRSVSQSLDEQKGSPGSNAGSCVTFSPRERVGVREKRAAEFQPCKQTTRDSRRGRPFSRVGEICAKHYTTREPVCLRWQDGRITSLDAAAQTSANLWLAPALMDVQVNGFGGVDFQQDDLRL